MFFNGAIGNRKFTGDLFVGIAIDAVEEKYFLTGRRQCIQCVGKIEGAGVVFLCQGEIVLRIHIEVELSAVGPGAQGIDHGSAGNPENLCVERKPGIQGMPEVPQLDKGELRQLGCEIFIFRSAEEIGKYFRLPLQKGLLEYPLITLLYAGYYIHVETISCNMQFSF